MFYFKLNNKSSFVQYFMKAYIIIVSLIWVHIYFSCGAYYQFYGFTTLIVLCRICKIQPIDERSNQRPLDYFL